MQRFYIKDLHMSDSNFTLSEASVVYQLVKVLRTRIGDNIILFDGVSDYDYICEVTNFSKKEIDLKFIEKIVKKSELTFELCLIQAFPNKLDKIEYILQKGVEVGIKNFSFFRSERSQKLNISEKKRQRLEKIIIEAVEQSGRNSVPYLDLLTEPLDFSHISSKGENVFFHTQNHDSQYLKDYVNSGLDKKIKKMTLFVGPEGGFSENEIKIFTQKGFSRIHLGNRILRTETAGVVTGFTLGQML